MSVEYRSRPHEAASGGPRPLLRAVAMACAAVLAAFTIAACGSPTGSSPAPGSSASGSSGGQGVNKEAAQGAIAPYTGKTSAFPVTESLSKPVPAGTKFAYLQCATQVCAFAGKIVDSAVTALGGTLTIINSGATAATSQAAASSALSLKPAALILAGIDPRQYGDSLQKISDAGIKIVSISVAVPTQPFGITANYLGAETFQLLGRLLANWVVVNKGPGANVAFYSVPEITFTPIIAKSFQDELAKNCTSCKMRNVDVGVATLGTTAPRTVVTDLQAHPETNTAVFSLADLASGVPAAMTSAGLSTTTLVYSPSPGNLQDIKDGKLTAGLAIDFASSVWVAVDEAARLILGDKPTASEQAGDANFQFLEQKDITFDASRGWVAYPDYQQRFTKLWHPAG